MRWILRNHLQMAELVAELLRFFSVANLQGWSHQYISYKTGMIGSSFFQAKTLKNMNGMRMTPYCNWLHAENKSDFE